MNQISFKGKARQALLYIDAISKEPTLKPLLISEEFYIDSFGNLSSKVEILVKSLGECCDKFRTPIDVLEMYIKEIIRSGIFSRIEQILYLNLKEILRINSRFLFKNEFYIGVMPQRKISGYRVDFYISVMDSYGINPMKEDFIYQMIKRKKWRGFVIECDSWAYHVADKERWDSHAKRMNDLEEAGYKVYSFTGRQIMNSIKNNKIYNDIFKYIHLFLRKNNLLAIG
jgi:hypothetical protein